VRIAGDADARTVAECLRLAPGRSADGLPWLQHGEVSATGDRAWARVVISSATPVFDPILRFALEDVCNSRLRREYTLLLSYGDKPAAAPARPAQAAAPASGESRRPARGASATQMWTTAPGESIDSLARALYPHDPAVRRRFVAATRAANPDLALGTTATTPLPPGTDLAIPDPSRLAASAPAARPAVHQPEPRLRRRDATSSAPAASAPRVAPAPSDRLRLREPGELGGGTVLGAPDDPAAGRERSLVRRQEDLVAALDRLTETQLALAERLRRLEEIEAGLSARADKLAAAPAPLAAPPALPATATVSAEKGRDWPYLAAAFGALAVLVAAALAAWRRRRAAPTFPFDREEAPPAEPADEAPTVVAAPTAEAGAAADPPAWIPEPLHSRSWPDASTTLAAAPAGPAAVAPIVVDEVPAEEFDSAIELAEIMVSFGRIQGAAETLAEFIRGNPKQSVAPWLKLLEVYRMAGLRPEFNALARQLNKTFNVKAVTWENFDAARSSQESLEQMPHIVETLQKSWGTRDCQAYLQKLLRDNREGTRQGFPLVVIDEILTLAAVLEDALGPYRAPAPAIPASPATQRHVA
jgi:MYXO-CTERM domain-containing protein